MLKWHDQIIDLLSKDLSIVRIFEELRCEGCNLSYSMLSKYVHKHKIKQNTCIRFHTKPGEEAQVDFGYVGRQYDKSGKRRKAYVFNMRLSYSRMDYYEVVFDQSVETWIRCHINAYNHFGGAPEVIKLDNLKAGVIDANRYDPILQKEYKRLAEHYDVLLSPCRPYQPQEKGKVESGIKYVKNNFFAGRKFPNNASLVSQLRQWNDNIHDRTHGTTKQKPREVYHSEELQKMGSLPNEDFCIMLSALRKVAKDCHVTFKYNYYSVPSKHVGSEVSIAVSNNLVKIYSNDDLVATHEIAQGKGSFITCDSHYAKNKRHCPGFKEYDEKYQEKIKDIGENASGIMGEIKKTNSRTWNRAAKGILNLCKVYDKEAVEKACKRALEYGTHSYGKVKSILENNCQELPIPDFGGYDANAS